MIARPAVRSRRTRAAAAVSLALVASLAIAGCGGSAKKASDQPSSQPTQGGTQLAAVWPLTGLPATGATPKHPVLVVKIDNTYNSEPQIGLGSADMVVEELVEGGITRLATLFYSKVPPVVGPVRSMRASDIGVVKPTHAVLIASGAAPPTYGRLNMAHVKYFTEGGPGYFRNYSRNAPYNLFVKLPELAASLKQSPIVPASYLPWGQESDFSGVTPATKISAHFSPSSTTLFSYDPATKKYKNINSHAGAGDRFQADSILVLRVREGDAGYLDPAGHHVPETLFYGGGALVLFHDGQLERGTWSKAKRESPLTLRTAAGELKVPAGHVWIELLPVNSAGGNLFTRR